MAESTKGAPSLKFLLADPAHFIALGFGSGLAPRAPGTFGTLFAWLSFNIFRPHVGDFALLGLFAAAYLLGIWVIDRTGRRSATPTTAASSGMKSFPSGSSCY